jgi:HPt (histidine-containing phosphotransfer) domain-containing protein
MELLDREAALEQVQGDEEFLNELYQIFYNEIPERKSAFAEAFDEGNGKKVASLAHSLKGVSLTIGAFGCKNLAEEVEHAAKAEDLEAAREKYARLETVLNELEKAIGAMDLGDSA